MAVCRAVLVSMVVMGTGLAGCNKAHPSVQYEKGALVAAGSTMYASLTVPPEFGLRPTATEGKRDSAVASPEERKSTESVYHSAGTHALLRAAGGDVTLPGIRALLDLELTAMATMAPAFIERLVFLTTPDPRPERIVILDGQPFSAAPSEGSADAAGADRRGGEDPVAEALRPVPSLPPPTIRRGKREEWFSLF